jgi:hypothetical protein
MTGLVVSGLSIMGTAATVTILPNGDTQADGIVYPASVPGWHIVDTGAALPADFSTSTYGWQNNALVRLPDSLAQISAAIAAKLLALTSYTMDRQGQSVTIASVGGFPTSFASSWLGLINGAYLAAQADISFVTEWQDEADSIHTLSAAQIITLWQAGTNYTNACFATQSAHRKNIEALTSMSAVNAYDFSTGWPSTSL